MKKRKKILLAGYLNYINAQNINCVDIAKSLDQTLFDITLLRLGNNQNDMIKRFTQICSQHKKTKRNAIFIFDGNCTRKFLDCAKIEANDKIFTKYFIPANFSKLSQLLLLSQPLK